MRSSGEGSAIYLSFANLWPTPWQPKKTLICFLFLFVICFHFLFWFISCFIFPVFSCPDHCFDLFLFYLFCFLLSRPPLTWEPTNTLGKERKHWWYFSAALIFPALRIIFLLFFSREQSNHRMPKRIAKKYFSGKNIILPIKSFLLFDLGRKLN